MSTNEAAERLREQRPSILAAIEAELHHAYGKHGDLPWGRHEFYAILLEEVEETWDAIKGDESLDRVAQEAVQVAAMCIRYLETGDRYQGQFPFVAIIAHERSAGAAPPDVERLARIVHEIYNPDGTLRLAADADPR